MAISHGRKLYFNIASTPSGGATLNLSTFTQEVSGLPGDQDLGDVTVAGNVGHVSYPGLQNTTFTTKMLFDDGASASWAVLGAFQSLQQTYPTVPWAVQYGPRGSTAAYPLITCSCWIKSIAIPAKVTDPNFMNVSWTVTGSTGVTVGVVT